MELSKALKQAHKFIDSEKIRSAKSGRKHSLLRYSIEDKERRISILVELKNDTDKWDKLKSKLNSKLTWNMRRF